MERAIIDMVYVVIDKSLKYEQLVTRIAYHFDQNQVDEYLNRIFAHLYCVAQIVGRLSVLCWRSCGTGHIRSRRISAMIVDSRES